MRIYDARIGKFFSVDPIAKEFPWNSPYAFAENDVIRSIDLDGLEKLVIHAKQIDEVGGTKIDVKKADFIAYQLSFTIDYPDGKIEQLKTNHSIVMFENKSFQEGKYAANKLKTGSYDLEWKKMSTFKYDKQLHIKSNGPGHSNLTYIHPLSTTAAAENNPNYAFTIGCKGVAFATEATISSDGTKMQAGPEFRFYENKGQPEYKTAPDATFSHDSWVNSYGAMIEIRDLYNTNQGKLQPKDNIQLKVE